MVSFKLASMGVSDLNMLYLGLVLSSIGYSLLYFCWQQGVGMWIFLLPFFVSTCGFPFLAAPTRSLFTKAIDADFYCLTGHKLYGPNAIGILYGKPALLEKMTPYKGGGDMIESVSFTETTYKPPPFRFEAGTPPIASVIGCGAAIDYLLRSSYSPSQCCSVPF